MGAFLILFCKAAMDIAAGSQTKPICLPALADRLRSKGNNGIMEADSPVSLILFLRRTALMQKIQIDDFS